MSDPPQWNKRLVTNVLCASVILCMHMNVLCLLKTTSQLHAIMNSNVPSICVTSKVIMSFTFIWSERMPFTWVNYTNLLEDRHPTLAHFICHHLSIFSSPHGMTNQANFKFQEAQQKTYETRSTSRRCPMGASSGGALYIMFENHMRSWPLLKTP